MLEQAWTRRTDDRRIDDAISDGHLAAKALEDRLGSLLTTITVDAPSSDAGEWFFDLTVGGRSIEVAWRRGQGYGLFTSDDDTYGSRPDEIFSSAELAASRIMMLSQSGDAASKAMHLGDLRNLMNLSQNEVASRMGNQQAAVSRLERHVDTYVSSIQKYVNALGGSVVLMVKFEGFEAPITLAEAPKRRATTVG